MQSCKIFHYDILIMIAWDITSEDETFWHIICALDEDYAFAVLPYWKMEPQITRLSDFMCYALKS